MKDDSFKDFVLDQLVKVGNITARKMFGGHGLYSAGTFFGIISGGVLYFKTDKETRVRYEQAGMDCFHASENQVLKNYYEVPADVLESPDALSEWADEAIAVAHID